MRDPSPDPGFSCPRCESQSYTILCQDSDRLYRTTKKVFSVIECSGCALIRLFPRPTPAELASFYPREYWFEESADHLWKTLSEEQIKKIEAVAIDMSQAFENTVRSHAPDAEIVHDKFHISKHLNEAVDKVRRQEHKALKKEGDDRLTGTKQLWLFDPENIREDRKSEFEALKNLELKTARAWAIKENFRWFWDYCYAGHARNFFSEWYSWAIRSRLEPIVKVAKMIKNRLPNVLTYFKHRITNAISEGYNSRIQILKANARGFKSFQNYRTRILFFCGKLDLKPTH